MIRDRKKNSIAALAIFVFVNKIDTSTADSGGVKYGSALLAWA